MTEKRVGEAFELGEKLTILGQKLHPGDAAPRFELDDFSLLSDVPEEELVVRSRFPSYVSLI